MRPLFVAVIAPLLVIALGCGKQAAPEPPASAVPEGSASAPVFTRPAPVGSLAMTASAAPAEPSAAPTGSADAVASASAAPDTAASAAPPPPLPDVEVKNIGLHIGGAPNDNETKAPVRDSVKPHFDALRACYAKAKDPKKEETFGVDIRIPREGGKAKIDKPRTGLEGEGVKECLVLAFEAIDFKPPATRSPMMASYSVRFTRK